MRGVRQGKTGREGRFAPCYLPMGVPGQPFFWLRSREIGRQGITASVAPHTGRHSEETLRSSDRHQAWLSSGGLCLHGLENRVEGDFTATHIQAVGQMRVTVQRGHAMLGKG